MSLPLNWELLLAIGALILALVSLYIALRSNAETRRSRRRIDLYLRERPTSTLARQSDPAVAAMHSDVTDLRSSLRQLRTEFDALVARGRVRGDEPVPSIAIEPPPAPARAASPESRPVEFDGEELRLSRSLRPIGALVIAADGSATARVFLNSDAEMNHVAYERWSALFEFRGGGYQSRYEVLQPALVQWDEVSGRGRLMSRGIAEAIA